MPDSGPWWLWPGRVGVVLVVLAGIGWLSNQPYGEPAPDALLRLAWRTTGDQVRLCRERSAEELSRLAPHMRQAQDCRSRTLPYRLEVRVNGQVRLAHPVQSVGAQGDRPLYVQDELVLPAGAYRLALEFRVAEELVRGPGGITVDSPEQEQALTQAIAKARAFRGEVQVQARPGRIILVELDERGGGFQITGG